MKVRDPVCGKRLYLDEAAANHEHDGWLYFFCSAECHRQFVESPGQYNGKLAGGDLQKTSRTAEKRRA